LRWDPPLLLFDFCPTQALLILDFWGLVCTICTAQYASLPTSSSLAAVQNTDGHVPKTNVANNPQIEKLFDVACCLADVVAVTPFSSDAFELGPRDYVSRFLTLISTLRGGQSRYLPLLLAKLSEVLPNLPLPRSRNLPQTLPASTIGMSGTGPGTVPSNMTEEFSAIPAVTSPSYPSTELIRRLAAQTGAQLPFNNPQQPMIQAPSSHVEDLSLYDTAHSTTLSSGSAPRSNSATPGPYESSIPQRNSQILTHASAQQPSPHPQHSHMQSHHMGVAPTTYDPRFNVQGYPVDPSMMFKQ
jgi:hypothetical protein